MERYQTVAEAVARVGAAVPHDGFTFQDMEGKETRFDFPAVEAQTAVRAAALQALGLQKGDTFGLVVVEPEDFVLTFLAALRVGVVPVPLYPPLSMGSLDAYADRTARILDAAQATVLVASERLKNILWGLVDQVPSLRKLVPAESLRQASAAPTYPEIRPEDLAFLQYTSGSTSDPKGVIVTHANLVANCELIIREGLKLERGRDRGVSWLPLYHDMGLIGFVIAPLLYGIPVVFIPTLRFIKRPNVWFDAIHRHRGTITFAPNFAYALATKRIKDDDLRGWDLSCVRAAGCGAEPIHPNTIREFTARFAELAKLPENAVLPAYGMAEATLAISFKPVSDTMRTRYVDAATFQGTGKVTDPADDAVVYEHVSCGPAFPGHPISVRDDQGNPVPEGVEGELCLQGPSVTPGYFRNPEATSDALRGGWLHTGDLGYLLDGEVYVTGRIKDLIILNGRNLHPQSVEWVVGEIEGVRKGNVVAFSVPGAESEELVIALEFKAEDTEALKTLVREAVRRELGLTLADLVLLPPGGLPKTSSGKLQRRLTRQQYLTGTLGGQGSRLAGDAGSTLTVAKHVARSLWSRAKAVATGA